MDRDTGKALIFGEVLFDCFPDGSRVLGGAPFNVAWHLQGLGLAPCLVSRVGDDRDGEQIRARMRDWGMDGSALQCDRDHPTGRVDITLQDGQPTFEIVADQAYDHIEADPAVLAAAAQAAVVYHGSLALRSGPSRQALDTIRARARGRVFVDINLRPPWWQRDDALAMVAAADWVKLNDDELARLGDDAGRAEPLPQRARRFAADHGLELLIVTCGGDGAWFVDGDDCLHGAPVAVSHIVDTVGAGDAFSAVTLYGLLAGWPRQQILDRALQFAAAVCAQRGAVSEQRDFYQGFLDKWAA